MGDMAWHGGGARRGRQQKLRRGPRPRLLALGLRAWGRAKSMRLTWMEAVLDTTI